MTDDRRHFSYKELVTLIAAAELAIESLRKTLITSDDPLERERSVDLYGRMKILLPDLATQLVEAEAAEHAVHRQTWSGQTWSDPDCFLCRWEALGQDR